MFEGSEAADRQIAALHHAEALAAHAFLAQCVALLELWDDSPEDGRTGERPQAVAEAAIALGLHPQTVQHRLHLAEGLRDHPLLRTQLRDGHLRVPHVLTALDEVDGLDDACLADQVLRAVLLTEGRIGWPGTPGELRRALARTAVRLDPAGAARRRALRQELRTSVRLRHRDSGLADWTATGPATSLLAADRLLDVLSSPTGPDDDRSRGQRQIDALVGALMLRAGVAVPLELDLQVPVVTTAVALHRGIDLPEPVRLSADLTPELLELLSTRPSTGTASAPPEAGELAQPVPARAPAPPAPGPARPTTSPTSAATDGTAVADSTAAASDGSQPRRVARHRPRQGVPELLEHGPVDPALLAALLTDPGGLPAGLGPVLVRRVCVDRHGQVLAADDRAQPLQQLLAGQQPPTGRKNRRAAGRGRAATTPTGPPFATPCATGPVELLGRLLDRLPQPPPTTTAHDPTAGQVRVLRARDPHCTFPGCSQASRRSENDHRVRHPDGPTALSNLHPQCKHHHRLQARGLPPDPAVRRLHHLEDPLGQVVTVRPP